MRYRALACDYDGTLTMDGTVAAPVLESLVKLRQSGRKIILVTGREIEDLARLVPDLLLFDCVVAENGAVLYHPKTQEESSLAAPPPVAFVEALTARHVNPIAQGRVIVATRTPHETTVLQVIRDMGLELNVSFNKGAVMILPSGVNKGFGLKSALAELALEPANVVGIGDAENDHTFLEACGCFVAVANALASLKDQAQWITSEPNGKGVRELIDELIDNDLETISSARL